MRPGECAAGNGHVRPHRESNSYAPAVLDAAGAGDASAVAAASARIAPAISALIFASARLCAAASVSKPSPETVSCATVRPDRVSPFALRTTHTASSVVPCPRIESNRCTSIVTRYCALKFASDAVATSGLPSSTLRSAATTRAILSFGGADHRLYSSTSTLLGPFCTTNCGRSTSAGIETGPTRTATSAGGAPSGADAELSAYNFGGGDVPHPARAAASATIEIRLLMEPLGPKAFGVDRVAITLPHPACRV